MVEIFVDIIFYHYKECKLIYFSSHFVFEMRLIDLCIPVNTMRINFIICCSVTRFSVWFLLNHLSFQYELFFFLNLNSSNVQLYYKVYSNLYYLLLEQCIIWKCILYISNILHTMLYRQSFCII